MNRTDWFQRLTGFRELPYEETRARLEVRDCRLYSQVNGTSYGIGEFSMQSVAELREQALELAASVRGRIRVSNVSSDVRRMHHDLVHEGALFQVASQFNALEMIGPHVCPEDGVTRYDTDATQGPACAIAAGAATIYRNYFVPVEGEAGQTASRQLDGLKDLGDAFGNDGGRLWSMRNGYAMCTADGYTPIDSPHWPAFAILVLEGAYEATLWAAVLNAARGASPLVFLTRLGGGAFGNDEAWIHAAMRRALRKVEAFALDVRLVSYGAIPPELRELAAEF